MLPLIQDNLPPHIQPLVRDLHTVTELITLAREAAAFLVGHATGRKAARLHTDGRSRTHAGIRPNRGPLRMGLVDTEQGEPHTAGSPIGPAALPLVSLPKEGVSLKATQKAAIVAALEAEDSSQARAAERLQMQGGALNQHIKRHQIAYPPEHAHKRRRRRSRALVRP